MQQYIISALLNHKIEAVGNPLMFLQFKRVLERIELMVKDGEGIDEEVKNIIDTCYKDAKKIIEDHMEQLQKCAQMLIEKEKINQQEFESIF